MSVRGVRDRSSSRCVVTFRDSVAKLTDGKLYVHRFKYCEHACYAENGRMSVWP
jgi:hypothetical protein